MKIGVFDSGLGGLTIVKSMMQTLTGVDIVYIADTAYAPYGEKTFATIRQRSVRIASTLVHDFNSDALVVACNTATAAAIEPLRQTFPHTPIVGTEPGIKPASLQSQTKTIGILATPATLQSDKYRTLAHRIANDYGTTIIEQACPGLVERIEAGCFDDAKTVSMLQDWLRPMQQTNVDTIVLGCTHYPLVSHTIRRIMKRNVTLVDTGEAIAKRLDSLLTSKPAAASNTGLYIYTTGTIDPQAMKHILNTLPSVEHIQI